MLQKTRHFSKLGMEFNNWPITKRNTVINIVAQETTAVIERFGKFHKLKKGIFFAIPFVDKIAYLIDKREQAIMISPLHAITSDNINLQISGNLFVKFTDEYKAAYGSNKPLHNITQFAVSSMRNSIGNMEIDEILKNRQAINDNITLSLTSSAENWGLEVKRYEITDISPDKDIIESMNKQLISERNRREQILNAKGHKESSQLISEGELIKINNESEGTKKKLIMEASGRAEALELEAVSKAKYIRILTGCLKEDGEYSQTAMQALIATNQIDMMKDIGQKSNTMFFSDKPADFKQLMAYAGEILKK